MKVYVITKGEYSDYYICGVVTDQQKAETLARIMSDNYGDARVEEYDTDEFSPIFEGKSAYCVMFLENGDVFKIVEESISYFEPGVCESIPKWCNGIALQVRVYAKDQKSAVKIAAEKRAKFLAGKMGL